MKSQFVQQIQILMELQHAKLAERAFVNNNSYTWLFTKKTSQTYWMSTKDELKIRRALNKISQEQEMRVLRHVLIFLERNPNCDAKLVVEITLHHLNDAITENFLNGAPASRNSAFPRVSSLRDSIRKFSLLSLRGPQNLTVPHTNERSRRSVTFNETPVIYTISNK
ncbi:uncharacterized protein LOC132707796 [Cylas formicarius]|uniref:uncharacterized protein LOC132707796 n=1 Tax=Cylas formicarius TaxID=197179 RepID=UPI0029584DAF|nr:uncharacterized protein LOC132707796 [Cylas formicarius]